MMGPEGRRSDPPHQHGTHPRAGRHEKKVKNQKVVTLLSRFEQIFRLKRNCYA